MSNAIITAFKNPKLNEIAGTLVENYKGFHGDLDQAKKYYKKAIVRRFMSGKLLSENHSDIIEELGSQRAFGEEIGLSEGMISNDKRAYEALAERGADTPEKMLDLLEQKGIQSTVYFWERMPKMLNEPQSYREPDRREKDEKRLEELYTEAEEIRKRHESASGNHIAKLASDTQKELSELKTHLDKLDPFSYDWRSRNYIDWTKSLGWDFINDEPAENLEFHHTDINSGSGKDGTKLPDVFGLPTTLKTHRAIEAGNYKPKPIQIASGLIKLMSLFIMNNYGNKY